ncbi:PREDICTED: peroxisome biogenesis protein 22-like isoform X2 [Nelumbo nucifera]|uniref:Peroxisome biogenesis protein 22-like isoform X2 n=1 Tax=Nelumbo nucifera TaxID=4432 RepID=A0A1U7YMB7_NELNU|nr:PREDICTED: peroxisome biogenesis protein 22-like isoform X2 [Nelumbo nucifera]
MGNDSSKEELVQLLKRFGAYLTVKMSNLFSISFDNLNSRSLGALAGLAIAIVFTWRLFRTPPRHQRRQPKRLAPTPSTSGVNTHSDGAPVSPGICSSEDSRAQNVIDEFFQPVKPTLGQIVRQKLSEGRKVTCRLLGVILEESSPEELQKQATEKVLLALENAGVFTSGGLIKDKVLFCSTENGRSSFVRQLEPDWHIDTNPEIIFQLARFIKFQLHISPNRSECTASNVFCSPTLEQFFGFPDRN